MATSLVFKAYCWEPDELVQEAMNLDPPVGLKECHGDQLKAWLKTIKQRAVLAQRR